MSAPNLPVVAQFSPPQGPTFKSESECSLSAVSRDLCTIAAFLQSVSPFSKLVRYEDWRNHDGLYFEHSLIDFRGLFQFVETPRAIVHAMSGDSDVCVGIVAEDRGWYLRFHADWDNRDENLIGRYSLTLSDKLARRF